jgi:hypothetical protein
MYSQKVNNHSTLLKNTSWFTTSNFLFCKGDLLLQKDSASLNQVKVVFSDSDRLIIYYNGIKKVRKYKLNNNYIELNLSDSTTHGVTMYCYYEFEEANKSVKLVGIDKKDFDNSNKK